MRVRVEKYIHDTGIRIWGGTIEEGLSRNSYMCPGHNTIAAYLDKKLPAKARKAVEDHMASCKECRIEAMELRKIIASTNSTCEMEEMYGY
ncbi:anti-sigma factor family protein [Oceanidesulfovibrio indonesiensis]|nr:zf-HC2 domain-containing protein [Oceanidesulfovibrio indonesiensis]